MIIFDSYYKFTKQTTPFHRRQNRMLAAIQTYGSKTECFISNPPLKLFLPQLSPSQQMPLPAHQLTKTLEPHRTPLCHILYSQASTNPVYSAFKFCPEFMVGILSYHHHSLDHSIHLFTGQPAFTHSL